MCKDKNFLRDCQIFSEVFSQGLRNHGDGKSQSACHTVAV